MNVTKPSSASNSHQCNNKDDDILSILKLENENDIEQLDLWIAIPKLVDQLASDQSLKSESKSDSIASTLNKISSVCNPKEVILILLAQLEGVLDSLKFCTILKSLQTALLRLEDKPEKSFQWCSKSIIDCLCKVEPPHDFNLEREEKLFLDNDDNYVCICNIYDELLHFCRTFAMKIQESPPCTESNPTSINKWRTLKHCLELYIVTLLGTPVVYMDLEIINPNVSKSRIRSIVESLMLTIFSVSKDVIFYFKYADSINPDVSNFSSDGSLETIPSLSLANFYYLVFCEEICLDQIPKMYSKSHLQCNLLSLTIVLMSNTNSLARRKGLLLGNFIFNKLGRMNYLEANKIEQFMTVLINCLIYDKTEDNRKLSFEVLKNYLHSLDLKQKYLILLKMHELIKNSSLKAYVITHIKDVVTQNFKHPLYSHKYLFDLIKLYCKLSDGATTDLMESASEINAALNLIRFLILRDKNNELGFKNYIQDLEKMLFSPLSKAIQISRAHWELKLEELTSNNPSNTDETDMSLTVEGQKLPMLPKEEQINVIFSAFNCLDLLASLLGRVRECIRDASSS